MKYSVHCPEFFSGTSTRNFLIFYMKLGCHLILKVTQLGLFEKKKSCSGVFGPQTPKMRFFKFHEKSTIRIFLIFFHKITVAYRLKIDLIELFGVKSCFEIFGPRVDQNGPKIRFLFFNFSDFFA